MVFHDYRYVPCVLALAHDPKGSPPSSQARVLEAFDVRSQMLRLEP